MIVHGSCTFYQFAGGMEKISYTPYLQYIPMASAVEPGKPLEAWSSTGEGQHPRRPSPEYPPTGLLRLVGQHREPPQQREVRKRTGVGRDSLSNNLVPNHLELLSVKTTTLNWARRTMGSHGSNMIKFAVSHRPTCSHIVQEDTLPHRSLERFQLMPKPVKRSIEGTDWEKSPLA